MQRPRFIYLLLLVFVLPVFWLQDTGCAKDYSFEGANTLHLFDTVQLPPSATVEGCALCNPANTLQLGDWRFKTGNGNFCGGTDNAGFIGSYNVNRTFTFFGPSACSIDTGIVMTVYLPVSFNEDKYNVIASGAAFYYYDHFGVQDIYISQPAKPFSVLIQQYIHSTQVVTGTFEGTVFKPNGDTAYIREGRFKVKLH
ncbi:MAG: hypothetical protein GC171_11490 [Terrimonas sp.]|nr:hypothetical protein [Terrimonas sp.]